MEFNILGVPFDDLSDGVVRGFGGEELAEVAPNGVCKVSVCILSSGHGGLVGGQERKLHALLWLVPVEAIFEKRYRGLGLLCVVAVCKVPVSAVFVVVPVGVPVTVRAIVKLVLRTVN